MRDVVKNAVKPCTAGKGVGYALWVNPKSLQARAMVSHAWDEVYYEFLSALRDCREEGAYWVCAMAIYQNDDLPEMLVKKQLGPDPMYGPFATVLRQASVMLAVIS